MAYVFTRGIFPSRLRLRSTVRRYACSCRGRSGLAFLVALAAFALATVLASLALPVLLLAVLGLSVFRRAVLGLSVLGLTILALAALAVGGSAALARGEIGGRR